MLIFVKYDIIKLIIGGVLLEYFRKRGRNIIMPVKKAVKKVKKTVKKVAKKVAKKK
jgi:hypothetical protein